MALNENRLDVAERLLKPHLKDDPFDVAAIRMLAELAARIGRWRDAESSAPPSGRDRARVHRGAGQSRAGARAAWAGRPKRWSCSTTIFAAEPDDLGHWNLKAATLGRLGDFDEAIRLYEERAGRGAEPAAGVAQLRPHAQDRRAGRPKAIAAYRKAIAIKPALGEAWWSLANLKTVKFDDDDVAAMEQALGSPGLSDEDRFHLDFALGKAMHDAGPRRRGVRPLFGGAMRCGSRASPTTERSSPRRSTGASSGSPPRPSPSAPGDARRRTRSSSSACRAPGSTLVEQILAVHSLVEGHAELPDIPALVRKAGRYPAAALKLAATERRELGEEYLKRAGVQRRTDRPFFIDKLPNNWLFVPFIQLILPNAKIIDARRHPLGCCLSNFRQHFARGQPFTYDLTDVGRYYADYVRLMAHVDAVLPGRVHRVIYERMVDDTEAEVRALLDYCGLEFEPACLEFYNTERAVRTASSEQVRQPIYREATEEWRAYEAHLGPLKAALGPGAGRLSGRARDLHATVVENSSRDRVRTAVDKSPPLCRNAVTLRMGAFDEPPHVPRSLRSGSSLRPLLASPALPRAPSRRPPANRRRLEPMRPTSPRRRRESSRRKTATCPTRPKSSSPRPSARRICRTFRSASRRSARGGSTSSTSPTSRITPSSCRR